MQLVVDSFLRIQKEAISLVKLVVILEIFSTFTLHVFNDIRLKEFIEKFALELTNCSRTNHGHQWRINLQSNRQLKQLTATIAF